MVVIEALALLAVVDRLGVFGRRGGGTIRMRSSMTGRHFTSSGPSTAIRWM